MWVERERKNRLLLRYCLSFIFISFAGLVYGQTLQTFSVLDKDGIKLSNIIVEIKAQASVTEVSHTQQNMEKAVMEQAGQQFTPHILTIAKGQPVVFPNIDDVFHHVYSFSPAKTFEITLEQEITSDPIVFDQAGIVELGCNVHDWMLGYIYVSDALAFGQTDNNGELSMSLSPGNYSASLWHPRLNEEDINNRFEISVSQSNGSFQLELTEPLYPSLTGYDSVELGDTY